MKATAALLHQRMRVGGDGTFVPPDDPPTIAIAAVENTAVEGDEVFFRIFQVSGLINSLATVVVTFTSGGGSADLVLPTVETVVFNAGDVEKFVSVITVNRSGTQGNRDLRATLTLPSGTTEETRIDPTRSFAITTLQDVFVAPAIIGAFTSSAATATEGQTLTAAIRRTSGDASATVNVTWTWASTLSSADFAGGAVLTGNATLNPSVNEVLVSVATALRTGVQGSRAINFTLSTITGGQVSTTNPLAAFSLIDFTEEVLPVVGVFADSTNDIVEGNPVNMTVRRTGGGNQAVSVNYAFTSSLSTADLTGSVSGTATLALNVNSVSISVATVNRANLQGDRNITCTLNSPTVGSIGEATAFNTLVDDVPVEETEFPKYQPTVPVSRWHCVGFNQSGAKATYSAGRAGLEAAMNASNLVAGDVIVLDNGTYSGSAISTSRSGNHTASGSERIMMRARNQLRAVVSLQLSIEGTNWWITGLDLTFYKTGGYDNYAGCILIRRSGVWITNCRATRGQLAYIDYNAVGSFTNLNICYNDIDDVTNETSDTAGICMWPVSSSQNAPSNSNVAWNHFANFGTKTSQHNFIFLQPSKPSSNSDAVQRSFVVSHNIMEGRGFFYTKRNVTYEYNFIDTGSSQGIIQRHGQTNNNNHDTGGIIRGNLFGSSMTIELNGSGQLVIGNRVASGSVNAALAAGQLPVTTGSGEHEAADFCTLVDNPGFNLTVGDFQSADNHNLATSKGGTVNDVRIYKGNRGWNPNIGFTSNGHTNPSSAITVNVAGLGGFPTITTITESELRAGAGCDSPA